MTHAFDTGYYTSQELRAFTFARVGDNVAIARNCTIVGLENITIGQNVRIDSSTTIIAASGFLRLGSHIQIGIGCVLGCRGGIVMNDYSSLSHGARLLSAVDDFSGNHMTNSTLSEAVLGVYAAPIRIGRYVPIGSGSTVLPGVDIADGAAVGARSLVSESLEGWQIYSGNPARLAGPRSRKLLAIEKTLRPAD